MLLYLKIQKQLMRNKKKSHLYPHHKKKMHLSLFVILILFVILLVLTLLIEGNPSDGCEKRYQYVLPVNKDCNAYVEQSLRQASLSCSAEFESCRYALALEGSFCKVSVFCPVQ